jgi:hypothetical protein
MYGGLKSAIQKSTKESDSLRKEVGLLQMRKADLNDDNQRIPSGLVDAPHTFDYLQGSVNSLRVEILGLVSVAAYITYLIKLQFEHLENLN